MSGNLIITAATDKGQFLVHETTNKLSNKAAEEMGAECPPSPSPPDVSITRPTSGTRGSTPDLSASERRLKISGVRSPLRVFGRILSLVCFFFDQILPHLNLEALLILGCSIQAA